MRKEKQKKKLTYAKPEIRSLGKVKGITQGGWGGWHGGSTRPTGGMDLGNRGS